MRFNNKNVILPEPWVQPRPANNEIWYTSSDGNIVTPKSGSLPTIVFNTYVDGKGIIKCASDITSIGSSAFDNKYKMIAVEIPNSVTSIGGMAFWYTRIKSFFIPVNVNNIGMEAFKYCNYLEDMQYGGTIAQYKAITKEINWNSGVPATVVHCTDGDAPI